MRNCNLSPEAQGGAQVCWAAREHKAAVGARARAKKAGPAAKAPTSAGIAGKKADVAMPLAPHTGAVGKVKVRAVPDEGPSPQRGKKRERQAETEAGRETETGTVRET